MSAWNANFFFFYYIIQYLVFYSLHWSYLPIRDWRLKKTKTTTRRLLKPQLNYVLNSKEYIENSVMSETWFDLWKC